MRISDWSSDVCSSDLLQPIAPIFDAAGITILAASQGIADRPVAMRLCRAGNCRIPFGDQRFVQPGALRPAVGDGGIDRIGGLLALEIDEIAVQVNIIPLLSPPFSKTARVYGVDAHHRTIHGSPLPAHT